MAADLLRYSRRWGFGLEEVTTTVHLWHGEQDPKVLITVARQVAAQPSPVPGTPRARRPPDACHHAGDILTALTSAFEQDAKGN